MVSPKEIDNLFFKDLEDLFQQELKHDQDQGPGSGSDRSGSDRSDSDDSLSSSAVLVLGKKKADFS